MLVSTLRGAKIYSKNIIKNTWSDFPAQLAFAADWIQISSAPRLILE